MKKFFNKKSAFLLSFLVAGFGVTQLYQNCAPVPLEGFTALSSETMGHEEGLANHPITTPEKPLPTQKRLVAPKNYVAQIFREVFTSAAYPTSNLEALIDKWVQFRSAQFGGACNLYSNYSSRDCSGVLANTNLNSYTDDNTVRESFRLQMCDVLLGPDNGVKAALEKVNLTVASPINLNSATAAYTLFYRNGPPDTGVIESLLDLDRSLSATNATLTNRWRMLLNMVCESPAWQLL